MLDLEKVKEMSQEERRAEFKSLTKEVRKHEITIAVMALVSISQITLMILGIVPTNIITILFLIVGGFFIRQSWVEGDKVDATRIFLNLFITDNEVKTK